jgi:hypothetical protein
VGVDEEVGRVGQLGAHLVHEVAEDGAEGRADGDGAVPRALADHLEAPTGQVDPIATQLRSETSPARAPV